MSDIQSLLLAFCLGMAMGMAMGMGAMYLDASKMNRLAFQSEAIKHHAAYYDAETGNFKWNDEK